MAEGTPSPAASSRWAPAADQFPRDLAELAGPVHGAVTLPLHLAWSGLRTFDLGDEKLLLGMYRIVLLNGPAARRRQRTVGPGREWDRWPSGPTARGKQPA
ncbi:hypothetical protein [Streptomyces fructofermentans]|uniref:hypothetical protein n=1 Tax=Streptomyces fructofermentans TaxID=152141 RepID=UPI0033C9240B